MRPIFEKFVDDESDSTMIRFRILKGPCINQEEINRKDTLFRLDRLTKKGYKGVFDKENDSTEKLNNELKRVQEWRAEMRK